MSDLQVREGCWDVRDSEPDRSGFVGWVAMAEELFAVQGYRELFSDCSDQKLMFLRDINRDGLAFQFPPTGSVHLSEEDRVLARLDARKISSGCVETHGRSSDAKENSRAPAFADSVKIEGDPGGEVIWGLLV